MCGTQDGAVFVKPFTFQDFAMNHESPVRHPRVVQAILPNSLDSPANSLGKRDGLDSLDAPSGWWRCHLHRENVTSVVSSFDDSHFATCGSDGGLFVFRNTMEELKMSTVGAGVY